MESHVFSSVWVHALQSSEHEVHQVCLCPPPPPSPPPLLCQAHSPAATSCKALMGCLLSCSARFPLGLLGQAGPVPSEACTASRPCKGRPHVATPQTARPAAQPPAVHAPGRAHHPQMHGSVGLRVRLRPGPRPPARRPLCNAGVLPHPGWQVGPPHPHLAPLRRPAPLLQPACSHPGWYPRAGCGPCSPPEGAPTSPGPAACCPASWTSPPAGSWWWATKGCALRRQRAAGPLHRRRPGRQ